MRRDPDDPFDDIFRELERMMNDMMGSGGSSFDADDMTSDTHVDIHEYDEEIKVIADLPGVTKDDIDLQSDGEVLSIRATSDTRQYDERIRLPVRVDEHSATANYNNGVLEITFERLDGSANINVE